ncbi:MAG: YqaE/Pmp3 family membrane protein [Bacteroidia bacterium]|nr:YqaE/Pmp3 family membrane protein [Bacteroidia bacterium]
MKTFFKAVTQSLFAPPSKGLLIVLAIFIPWLAVGLATDWEFKHVLINILLGLFTCLGGIIHAIIIVNKYAK